MAHIAKALAIGVQKFCGEGALAHARRVRLDDADDGVDLGGADAGARAGAARRSVGRRDERVRAVIDVEHRRLAALEEHVLARVDRLVEDERRVGDHRRKAVAVTQQLVSNLVDRDGAAVVDLDEQVVLHRERALNLVAQHRLVKQVAHADAEAIDLVRVSRADAAARGADLAAPQEALGDLVQGARVGRDHVRRVRNQQL